MTRVYGRSQKARRLKGTAPFRWWGNQTLIAGLSCEGVVAPWVISGAMDRAAFDTYIEKVLIPELEPGSVVILDNLATHKSGKATELLKAHGCWFLFLPAYSPDLNPIEMAFSKLKAHLIPTVIDQNPCAHLRMPRDMIFHGWSMRLFQAWQHSATMSS